eukprot:3940598-Rhodomonas_salina.1
MCCDIAYGGVCYAICGTAIAYGGVCYAVCGTAIVYRVLSAYAMFGTSTLNWGLRYSTTLPLPPHPSPLATSPSSCHYLTARGLGWVGVGTGPIQPYGGSRGSTSAPAGTVPAYALAAPCPVLAKHTRENNQKTSNYSIRTLRTTGTGLQIIVQYESKRQMVQVELRTKSSRICSQVVPSGPLSLSSDQVGSRGAKQKKTKYASPVPPVLEKRLKVFDFAVENKALPRRLRLWLAQAEGCFDAASQDLEQLRSRSHQTLPAR